jgi:glycosyltransferase involved in cell wall biosynthesis
LRPEHFILIGNYPPDRQESMIRFADLLANGLKTRGFSAEIITPKPIMLKKNSNPGGGLAKWLGYVDKWILFPFTLRRIVRKKQREFGDQVFFHVCDHSNAPYLAHLPAARTAITCHDVLAIRGALGFPDSYCPASRAGVFLQKWILKNLRRAKKIACVSKLTLRQLEETAGEKNPPPGWTVVPNALNADFKKIETEAALEILQRAGIKTPRPFLLHVGSNLPRKNRRMLLQMVVQSNSPWLGHICFAGEPVDDALLTEARELKVSERVHSVTKPSHEMLCALYSLAHTFVFPSLSEGFGWPLIEAQACGTPVIASNFEPLPEVSGGTAIHANPHEAKSFAAALQSLENSAVRNSLVERGQKNSARFTVPVMIDQYLSLHGIRA